MLYRQNLLFLAKSTPLCSLFAYRFFLFWKFTDAVFEAIICQKTQQRVRHGTRVVPSGCVAAMGYLNPKMSFSFCQKPELSTSSAALSFASSAFLAMSSAAFSTFFSTLSFVSSAFYNVSYWTLNTKTASKMNHTPNYLWRNSTWLTNEWHGKSVRTRWQSTIASS